MSNGEGRWAQRERLHKALVGIRHSVVGLHDLLQLDTGIDLDTFRNVLDTKLILQLDPDYPLLVAITGGGSTGKSSLFNALVGRETSAVKAKAGVSRRVLAAIHPDVLAREGFLASLFEAFGGVPEPLGETAELTDPGVPKYVPCPTVPPHLVLLDTPDFDTGDRDGYTNRAVAKPVLEACDVLVYIFTNATYNNRANTEFVRHVLTEVGHRKAMLVYRCSRALSDEEIRQHSSAVAGSIYGSDADRWVLGVYRTDEEDRVATGESLLTIRTHEAQPEMKDALASLDRAQTRADFVYSALRDVADDAQRALDAATAARLSAELYRDTARVATKWAATRALKSFPQRELLLRFAGIWEQTQPQVLRVVRGVGRAVSLPVKGIGWVARQVGQLISPDRHAGPPAASPQDVFTEDLFQAVNELRRKLMGDRLATEIAGDGEESRRMIDSVREICARLPESAETKPRVEDLGRHSFNIIVPRPAAMTARPGEPGENPWKETLERLLAEAAGLAGVSEDLDVQLRALAREFRASMGWREKVRETFTASLHVLPPVVAVTYVLATGDPAGGGTIYTKLAAAFGANDLWALIAIPASTGLSELDRKNLEGMLGPIFKVWFSSKWSGLVSILEERVADPMISESDALCSRADKPLAELERALARLPKENAS